MNRPAIDERHRPVALLLPTPQEAIAPSKRQNSRYASAFTLPECQRTGPPFHFYASNTGAFSNCFKLKTT
ncbi:unnamed protein product [Chondrus crispus]|uniref:Uncharacterized protein n=1 Tax=Chondrus crispus TaxID=2769 RepID=R7QN30_CHOCR|nr:unnamed protein product [Chondrus crispus]CDF38795.1 unnamed protein product [Chondrus crispus]|eukprot:XP_005718700.1 unnamed protein product [Chondrus crispus]